MMAFSKGNADIVEWLERKGANTHLDAKMLKAGLELIESASRESKETPP